MNQSKTLIPDLPRAVWGRVVRRTGLVTFLTVIVSLVGVWLPRELLEGRSPTEIEVFLALVLPVVMAVPIIGSFIAKLEELHLAYAELDRFAKRDALTGLLNRGAMVSGAEDAFARAARFGLEPSGCLLVIDVDLFKTVNDNYGHDAGDDALRLIAGAISRNARETDLVGRMGGEEFAVFLAGASLKTACGLAERIRRDVEQIVFAPEGEAHPLSISIGLSSWSADMQFRDVYRDTDVLLYQAKKDGRNRVVERTQLAATG